jgi:hypothetical protein
MVPETAAGQREEDSSGGHDWIGASHDSSCSRARVARGGPLGFIPGLLPLQWPQNAGTRYREVKKQEQILDSGWCGPGSCTKAAEINSESMVVIICPTYNIITGVIAARKALNKR